MWHWYHQWVLKKRKQTNGKPKSNTASSSFWVIHGIMGDLMHISSTFRTWELSSHLKIGGCREAHSNLNCIPEERMRLESLWPGKAGNNTGSPYSAQCDGQHSLLPFQLLPASCLSLECVYLWVCVDIWPPVIKLNCGHHYGKWTSRPWSRTEKLSHAHSVALIQLFVCLVLKR